VREGQVTGVSSQAQAVAARRGLVPQNRSPFDGVVVNVHAQGLRWAARALTQGTGDDAAAL
jgi:hypothetical protein